MDKSTDSPNKTEGNHSGGDKPPQTCDNISLGCGSSTTANSSSASSTTSPVTASHLTPSAVAIPLPLGAPHPIVPTTITTTTIQPSAQPLINLNINTTTGGNFGVSVDPSISVENLKKIIAKKLKVAKDRICLLHREKELQDGTLKNNNLMDGSKIILIPNVETGLLAQRPENTVMQALESLNDSQVNDFLSGKTPLNLSMRLGDHMMLIQLQLSTVNPVNNASINGTSCSSSRTRSSQRSNRSASVAGSLGPHHNHHSHHHHHHHHHHSNVATTTTGLSAMASSSVPSAQRKLDNETASSSYQRPNTASNRVLTSHNSSSTSTVSAIKSSDLSSFLSKRDYESLQSIVKSIAMAQPTRLASAVAAANTTALPVQQLQQTINTPTAAAAVCSATTANSQPSSRTTIPTTTTTISSSGFHSSSESALLEQSPIKSLSNLVSSPIKTTAIKNIPIANGSSSSSSSTSLSSSIIGASSPVTVAASCQDPIAAKLTSCLCTRLNGTNNVTPKNCIESSCLSRHDVVESAVVQSPRTTMITSTPNYKATIAPTSSSVAVLHKTANNPISRSKHRHHHHHHHHHHHYHHHNGTNNVGNATTPSPSPPPPPPPPPIVRAKMPVASQLLPASSNTSSFNESGFVSDDSNVASSSTNNGLSSSIASSSSTISTAITPNGTTVSSNTSVDFDDSGIPVSDTRTLAEASRNLTQTLRKLSKEVFTNKIDLTSSEEAPRKSGSGAVIESMKNHGKGIYSGTFSGTLNPALQDRYGRPKRDISTVIHILNDLLSATPQYSRGARISFETPATSPTSITSASAPTNGSSSVHSSRSKQLISKHHHSCVKCIKTPSHNHGNNGCSYGECNGHYVNKTTTKPNYSCCQDSSAIGSNVGNSMDTVSNNPNDRTICSCRYAIINETGEREREHICQKCLIEMENKKTKSKLDQLRLVMQQRKQKREARKLKGAPYGARVVGVADAVTATASATATASPTTISNSTATQASGTPTTSSLSSATPLTTAPPSEVSPNHIVEEVDTAA